MQHQQAAPVSGFVHHLVADLDLAEQQAIERARCLVVVARHEHHPRALVGLFEDALQHQAVGLRPVATLFHVPEVDDVADQEQRVALHPVEKVSQEVGAATGKAQVHV
ncbi:hypothetical protein D3C83_65930 [compost metagenome]